MNMLLFVFHQTSLSVMTFYGISVHLCHRNNPNKILAFEYKFYHVCTIIKMLINQILRSIAQNKLHTSVNRIFCFALKLCKICMALVYVQLIDLLLQVAMLYFIYENILTSSPTENVKEHAKGQSILSACVRDA